MELLQASDRYGAASGLIQKQRLLGILSRLGCELSTEEEQLLVEAFGAQEMPEQVNARKLAEAIENETVTSEDLASEKVVQPISNSGEYDLVNALLSLHGKLVARRKRAADVFAGLTDEPISLAEFRKRVQNYGLVVPFNDIERITRKYRVNLRGDIDWKTFCTDCDTIRTVQSPR
jgi:Ca2+-binding EF-hand superfamily protein